MDIKESVVLASGLGTRISDLTKGKPKFLLRIEDIPIILYPIRIINAIGINKINVIVPKGWAKALSEILSTLNIRTCIVENEHINRENGYSLLLARECISSREFLLSMCDHIYEPKLVKRIISSFKTKVHIMVGGDSNPLFIDREEATKILTDKELNVLDIGKGIKQYNYIDVGVFVMSREVFDIAEELEKKQYSITLSEVVKNTKNKGLNVKVSDVTGCLWTEVDTVDDYLELTRGKRRIVLEKVLSYIK